MHASPDRCLLFRTVPQGVKKNRRVKLIYAELSGIQRFIFRSADVGTSAEEIGRRSAHIERVTELCVRFLADQLKFELTSLNVSSGKLLLAASRFESDKRIEAALKELQRIVYGSLHGTPELYYAFTNARITDELKPDSENAMETLQRAAARNRYHCTNLLCIDPERYVRGDFVFRAEPEARQPAETKTAMAIKLDLDNLGAFFGSMQEIDVKDAASAALNETLKNALSGSTGIRQIFAGGDDLFLVASTDAWIPELGRIYRRIRQGVEQREELRPYRGVFGISGGVCPIRNRLASIPLLYYYEESETALEQAKAERGKNILVVDGVPVTWDELLTLGDALKQYGDAAFRFMTDADRAELMPNVRKTAELLGKSKACRLTQEQRKHLETLAGKTRR